MWYIFTKWGAIVSIGHVAALAFMVHTWGREVVRASKPKEGMEQRWPGKMFLNNISGVPTAPFVSTQRMQELVNGSFDHRDDDVWVATYPKSGTTWAITLLGSLRGNKIHSATPSDIHKYCPWPEHHLRVMAFPVEALKNYTSPRCLKSHWLARDHLAPGTRRGKVIFVMRNAIDVALSFYHHLQQFAAIFEFEATWEEFFPLFAAGDVPSGNYFRHLASWWPHKEDQDVLWMRYEDMWEDTAAQIQRIATFTGIGEVTPERVKAIRNETSFERMQQIEMSKLWPTIMRTLGFQTGLKARRGGQNTPDGPGPKFTAAMCAEMEAQYEAVLKPLGVPKAWALGGDGTHPVCKAVAAPAEPTTPSKTEL